MPHPRPAYRRRAVRRDVLASLALVAVIFVSVLALPFGRVHAQACRIAGILSGQGGAMPCGLVALSIHIDTDRSPFVAISVTPLKLPISL
jgi:hypothetical protein